MRICDQAITRAREFVGKTETKSNDGQWLRDLMYGGGNPGAWTIGEPYCIAALLAIFNEVLTASKGKGSLKAPAGRTSWLPFDPSASSQTTYDNAAKAKLTGEHPDVGDIVIFRKGNTWQGHAGLVTNVVLAPGTTTPIGIDTIEFNTSASKTGDQRNGEGCFAKERLFSHFPKTDAHRLWIRGYIKTSQLT